MLYFKYKHNFFFVKNIKLETLLPGFGNREPNLDYFQQNQEDMKPDVFSGNQGQYVGYSRSSCGGYQSSGGRYLGTQHPAVGFSPHQVVGYGGEHSPHPRGYFGEGLEYSALFSSLPFQESLVKVPTIQFNQKPNDINR